MGVNVALRPKDWDEKHQDAEEAAKDAKMNVDTAAQERREALKNLQPTKDVLRRVSYSWTYAVEEQTIGKVLNDMKDRINKYDNIFERHVNHVQGWLQSVYQNSTQPPTFLPRLSFEDADVPRTWQCLAALDSGLDEESLRRRRLDAHFVCS